MMEVVSKVAKDMLIFMVSVVLIVVFLNIIHAVFGEGVADGVALFMLGLVSGIWVNDFVGRVSNG